MKILALFFLVFSSYAKEDFWDSFDSGDHDYKFAYFEEIDESDATPEEIAKELEVTEMKKRAKDLKDKIAKENSGLKDIEAPASSKDAGLKNEIEEEQISQNVPLTDKDFEFKDKSKRNFTYDPIVQYKEKTDSVNYTDKKKNYFLPWEQKYKSLIPHGVILGANYNFGSVSESNNNATIETQKEAQLGFKIDWTFYKKFRNDFSLVFSSNLHYTYISTSTTNIELSDDFQVFERVHFPTLRFSYLTPHVDLGFSRFSHISSLTNTSTLESHTNSGFFMGGGLTYRAPIRNTMVLLVGNLRRHLGYTSSPQTAGTDITGISGWEYSIGVDWFISENFYIDALTSSATYSSSENIKLTTSNTYAGIGFKF